MGKMDIMDNMDIQILRQAARTQGTPAYVFDLDAFARRIRHMKKVLGQDIKILYAMKANPFFTRTAAQEADGLEVCSPGEYAICRRAGVPLEKIVLSGVNKEAAHVREVVGDAGISGPAGRSGADALSGPAGTPGPAAYTAESLSQLDLLESCAAKTQGNPLRVLLRLTSGNQFGMDEETILSISKNEAAIPICILPDSSTTQEPRKSRPARFERNWNSWTPFWNGYGTNCNTKSVNWNMDRVSIYLTLRGNPRWTRMPCWQISGKPLTPWRSRDASPWKQAASWPRPAAVM